MKNVSWGVILGVLVAAALGLTVVVGAAAATSDVDPDAAEIELTVENDGSEAALGVPAAVDGSWVDQFPNGTEGLGAIHVYDDGWEQVTDLANKSPEPLAAYRLQTTGVGPDTIALTLAFETDVPAVAERSIGPGWEFFPPATYEGAETAFDDEDWVSVLQRHHTPSVQGVPDVDRFSRYTVGSERWADSAPAVSPFGGYYLYAERETTRSGAVSDVRSIHDLRVQLGASDPYPHFAVGLATNTPITEGDTLTATATVRNLGTTTDTQTVSVSVANVSTDEELPLDPGETSTVSLAWETASGDAGTYDAVASSANATTTQSVTVIPAGQAAFAVSNLTPESTSLDAGEPYSVSADVENVGDAEATETVTLALEDTDGEPGVVATTEETLEPNESTTVTFEDVSTDVLGGEYTVTVASPHDEATGTLEVIPHVESLSLSFDPDPVPAGQQTVATVTADLSDGSTADVTAESTLSSDDGGVARVDGAIITTRKSGTVNITASHPDGTVTRELEVTRGTIFDVDITSTNQPIKEGERLRVHAEITNLGLVRGQQPISLTNFADETVQTRQVTLQRAGHVRDSRVRTLTWKTQIGDAGTGLVGVHSLDDSDQVEVTIEEGTLESIDLSLEAETIAVGETVNATVSGTYEDGTTVDLTGSTALESDDSGIASVTNGSVVNATVVPGTVTGESEGIATITASVRGQTDTVSVTVDGELAESVSTQDGLESHGEDGGENDSPAEPGYELPVQQLSIENDGAPKTVAIPGAMNGTLADLFPEGTAGVGTIYAYDSGWEQLHTLDSVALDPLDAVVLSTRGDRGPDEITLEVPFELDQNPTVRTLDAGWNLVAAPAATDAESAYGGNLDHTRLVLDRFDGPTVEGYNDPGSFSHYIIGSHGWGANVPSVNPFTGYFVHVGSETTLPTVVSDLRTQTDLEEQLGTAAD